MKECGFCDFAGKKVELSLKSHLKRGPSERHVGFGVSFAQRFSYKMRSFITFNVMFSQHRTPNYSALVTCLKHDAIKSLPLQTHESMALPLHAMF